MLAFIILSLLVYVSSKLPFNAEKNKVFRGFVMTQHQHHLTNSCGQQETRMNQHSNIIATDGTRTRQHSAALIPPALA
jgi:hypothetical protein